MIEETVMTREMQSQILTLMEREKAKNTNLKQFAETIRFLEEQDEKTTEQLTGKIQELDITAE